MPMVSISTNVTLEAEAIDDLLAQLTTMVSRVLEKPVEYVQVGLNAQSGMYFAGTNAPTAFVDARALGLSEEKAKTLAVEMTRWIEASLSIEPARLFINLLDVPRTRWAWNGETFG